MMTYPEIALELGVSTQAAQKLASNAMRKLRGRIAPEYRQGRTPTIPQPPSDRVGWNVNSSRGYYVKCRSIPKFACGCPDVANPWGSIWGNVRLFLTRAGARRWIRDRKHHRKSQGLNLGSYVVWSR
jgi:hypothetical protein